MGQPDGDGDGRSREEWIRGRIAELRRGFEADAAELADLTAELEAMGLTPEERRRRFRVIPGGLLVGGGVLTGLRWVRHRPRIAAGLAGASAALVAGAVLSHGAPPPRHGATGPVPRPTTTPTAPASGSMSASPSPTTRPRTPVPPLVPVPVVSAVRGRRPSPSQAPPTPPAPSPTPTRPGPSPSASSPLPALVLPCPPGLTLVMLGIGVYVCV